MCGKNRIRDGLVEGPEGGPIAIDRFGPTDGEEAENAAVGYVGRGGMGFVEGPDAEVGAVLEVEGEDADFFERGRFVAVDFNEAPKVAGDCGVFGAVGVVEVVDCFVERKDVEARAFGGAFPFEDGPGATEAGCGRRAGVGKERRDEEVLGFARAADLAVERPEHPGGTRASGVAIFAVGGPGDDGPERVVVVAFTLVARAREGPHAPRAVRAPMNEREENDVRSHPFACRGARHFITHPKWPEREVPIVHQKEMRVVTIDGKKPRVRFAFARAAIEPKRKDIELIRVRFEVPLIVNKPTAPPPIAMAREERPKNIRRLSLVRVERPRRLVVVFIALRVEGAYLESRGE